MKILIAFAILLFAGSLTSSSAIAQQSEQSRLAQPVVSQTVICSPEVSDRFCSERTAASRCQGLHGVGLCSIVTDVPKDRSGLPACMCL